MRLPEQETVLENRKTIHAGKMKPRRRAVVLHSECVACGSCMKACPLKAIKILCGTHASVCHKTCIGCGRCRTACSASVIRMEASA